MKKGRVDSFDQESLLSSLDIQGWNLKSFAEELYENTGQLISLAKIQLAGINIEKRDETKDTIESSGLILNRVIRNLRSLARQLSPADIIQKGFLASIQYELERLDKLDLWKIHLSVTGNPFKMDESRELILFSIIQHFMLGALYVEKVKQLEVSVNFSDNMIKISLFYPVYPKPLPLEKKPINSTVLHRAMHIGAGITLREKDKQKEISIRLIK